MKRKTVPNALAEHQVVKRSNAVRRAVITLAVLVVSLPFVIRGSDLGLKTMFNAPLLWIEHDSETRRDFNEFLDLFGAQEMIVVTWPGCTVADERLATAAAEIERVQHLRASNGEPAVFNQVLTGNTMLQVLTSPPIELSEAAALRRLEGFLVGPDGRTSCMVVELTGYGGLHRRESIPIMTDAIVSVTGLTHDQLILSGPAIDGIAIDDESIRSINTFSLPSVLISFVLCWLCLRSLRLTLPILIVGAWGQGLMLALVYYLDITMNAILIVLPALVFVLTVSTGIHLANYFLEEVGGGSRVDAAHRAIRKAVGPCSLAALTTAIGLASLCISEVAPVRQFGFLGAIGVIVCVATLFLLLPGFMVFDGRRRTREDLQVSSSHAKRPTGQRSTTDVAAPQRVVSTGRLKWVAHQVYSRSWAIRLVCFVAMVLCSVGLTKLHTTIDIVSLLSDDSRVVEDFHWIEKNIGPLVPIEVVVHFAADCSLDPIERLKTVAAVQHQVSQIDVVEGAMSAVTFIANFPRGGGIGGTVRKTIFLRQLESSRPELIAGKYLAVNEEGEFWRITGRIPGQPNFDYEAFLQQVQSEADSVLTKLRGAGFDGVTVSSTGVLVLVYQVQEVLLSDLFKSFITAMLLVAIVMIIALKSVTGGLLAMLPNLFPTVVLFGVMGWFDYAIDIGTVMTASVALGIAVDGTFHFLKRFTRSVEGGVSREAAVVLAYERCGPALIQTTVICACGLLIYSFSDFLPVRHFAWVLLMMLVFALFGDLILLPALLSGALGRLLLRNPRNNDGSARTRLTGSEMPIEVKEELSQ